jgi:hypothetical protein
MQKTQFSAYSISTWRNKVIVALLVVVLSFTFTLTAYADDSAEIVISVSNGEELDAALRGAVSGNTRIVLTNDIDAITSATYSGYVTGTAIAIDGQGYKIDGLGADKTGLRFGARGQNVDITLRNTVFANMRNNDRHGGGAIAVWRGTVDISECAFYGNILNNASSGGGGAVLLQTNGLLNVSNSTFTDNHTPVNGGALHSGSGGTLNNVTVFGNSSATGIGGASGALAITNSIISGNTTNSETAAANVSATAITEGGNNLIGIDTVGWLADALNADNVLALIQVADSPAIDKGNPETATAYDQRGIPRDAAPDIGAFEFEKNDAQGSTLKLSTDAHLVANDDYANIQTAFGEAVNANTAILRYAFDTDTFEFADFHPADGVTVISKDSTESGATVIVMVPNYNMQFFGALTIHAKPNAPLSNGSASVYVNAEYVVKDETGGKEILFAEASTTFTTRGNGSGGWEPTMMGDTNADGVINLIDLSNMIDWFGITASDAGWTAIYTFFDFNNSGAIDIYDVAFVAMLLKA